MHESQLTAMLEQGENAAIEFKSVGVRAESLAREIVAFANTQGGTILLGVGDGRQIEGLTDDRNWEEWAMNIARTAVTPPLSPRYQEWQRDGRRVGVLQIERGYDKPYQTTDGKFYVRVGSTNRSASAHELMRLFQQAGFFHYDQTAVRGTSAADLNVALLNRYFEKYEVNFQDEASVEQRRILANADILAESGETTVAGLLVFGQIPSRWLPQAVIRFAHFVGHEPDSELIDRKEIAGTLGDQIDQMLVVIRNNLLVPSRILGARREESPSYPDKVYRELLANACMHRNYSIHGSGVRVLMYADRIEFISPGKLPNTITPEKLKIGVSYAVNPIIVKFMDNLRYTDRLGRGLPMVYRESVKIGRPAEFIELGEEFRVILPLPNRA